MTRLALAALALLAACAAPAEDILQNTVPGAAIATWGEFSGSLPPEFAWDYVVTFADNQTVSARYCKGYADAAPGCAVAARKVSDADYAALLAALAPLGADLAAKPPRELGPDETPIGGGAVFGTLVVDGATIRLPAWVRPSDAARSQAVLDVLRLYTPADLVSAAEARATYP